MNNKKHTGLWTLLLLCLTLMVSCVDYSDTTQAINVDIRVEQPTDATTQLALGGHTMTLTREGGGETTAVTDANGIAHFTELIPDVYTVSVSWPLSADEYRQATGDTEVNDGAIVAGSSHSQLLTTDMTASPMTLATQFTITRSLVISKVFYAGMKDVNKKNYLAAQYIELYNQGDEAVDIAGMYLGLVESNASPAYTLEQIASGFQDSVVVLKQLFRIPAATPHLVNPGQSVVITNSAIDHTANVGTPMNLSDADYEAKDAQGKTLNNPATPALELVYTAFNAISKMNIGQGGPTGVVLFRSNAAVNSWQKVYNYGKTSGSQWLAAGISQILDGVDILKYKNTGTIDLATKRLLPVIDAGATYIHSASGYNGETVYRKKSTRKGAKGQYILQDTNNSTNDFSVSSTLTPRNYEY
ncbi:DUF4876 domain-containing protein [Hallella absiana]|uniref:DUF4876 domain-containing protein n=1 Tax=Hallella absiana TaxID=2925336 RepID=UPI0021C90AEF|nr:DUF4876 domain-containing protein [Hallella absiana]